MATVTIEYYGMDGTGKNVTEAKKDAGEKIKSALSGTYSPEILAWRGYVMLVYREPTGWYSRLIGDPERGMIEGTVYGTNYDSREDAMRSARLNLSQLGWKPQEDDTPPPFLTDREGVADFKSWVLFQQRYAKAKATGLNDHECHTYGCGSLGRPDLINRVEG